MDPKRSEEVDEDPGKVDSKEGKVEGKNGGERSAEERNAGERSAGDPREASQNPDPLRSQMRKFYNHIVSLSRQRTNPDLLRRAIEVLAIRILQGSETNIEIAARHCHNSAYIFAYEAGAMMGGNLSIHEIVSPSDTVQSFLHENGIIPLIDRLREVLEPFEISHTPHEVNGITYYLITVVWPAEETPSA